MAYTTIDDSSAHFQTALYTGNNSDNAITNDGNSDLQPDFIWVKNRGAAQNHVVFDSTRGFNGDSDSLYLEPNNTDAEAHDDDNHLKSFNSDGFTMQASSSRSNNSSYTYVAWQWKANGGTTSSNTSGSITSTVQANTTSGFSIITYTGNATDDATFGHGLGVVPHFIIIKARNRTNGWPVYHRSQGADKALFLSTNAAVESSSFYQATPTSTLITLNDHSNVNNENGNYICYCFTEIQGYSKIGSYEGNGNADGPFVYTGFKPAWVMFKRTDSTNDWLVFDHKRDTYNLTGNVLYANEAGAEQADALHSGSLDLLSNGFKMRETGNSGNGSGASYIYAAFAEQPFVTSGGVPCTAR